MAKQQSEQSNQANIMDLFAKAINVPSILKRYDRLKSSRNEWTSKWQTIQNYVFPNYRDYLNPTSAMTSQAQTGKALNFTSTVSGKISRVVAQISSQLCDPSTKWLGIKFVDPIILANGMPINLSGNQIANAWLSEATEAIYNTLANPDSNFYPSTYTFHFDWYTIGTACREVILRKDTGKIRFNTVSMQNIFIDVDGYGEIDVIFRAFNLTSKQAYDLWGEQIHESEKRILMQDIGTNKQSAREYVEVSMKNPLLSKGIPSLPFVSCVIDKNNKHIVNIELHKQKPYIISRFDLVPNEVYGRSNVWNAMPDIIAINRISKRILQAYDYALSPPLLVKDITSIAKYQMSPNSYIQGLDESGRPSIQPLQIGSNLPFSIEYYTSKLNDLDESLMARDIFNPETSNMTATEVNERKIQASNRIRPVLTRLEHEDLNKTILRTISLLMDIGVISPFPFEALGIPANLLPNPSQQISITFSGQMAKMQKMQDVQNNDLLFNKLMAAVQVDPSVLDRFNMEALIMQDAEIFGISPKIINPDEVVQQIRLAKQEQAIEAAKQQQKQQQQAS